MNITWINEENQELQGKAYCLHKASKKSTTGEFMVSHSFVINKDIFTRFLAHNHLKERIEQILANKRSSNLKEISYTLRDQIYNSQFPQDLKDEIIEAYKHVGMTNEIRTAGGAAMNLVSGRDNASVVLIPNINGNEVIDKIWNVMGNDAIIEAVKNIYASFFSPEALYYFQGNNLQNEISIIIQQMPQSDKSCIVYTRDPRDNSENILVEANIGLPPILERGEVISDIYLVSKTSGELIKDWITKKEYFYTKDGLSGELIKERVGDDLKLKSTLTSPELTKLIQVSASLEEVFRRALKIEYSLEKGRIKVTDISSIKGAKITEQERISGTSIAKGIGAALGTVSGTLKSIKSYHDIESLEEPSIIHITSSNKEIIPYMDKISGIISNRANISSFVSQLARERGVPFLITPDLTPESLEQKAVYLDTFEGEIYPFEERRAIAKKEFNLITGTDIKLNGPVTHPDSDGCVILERMPYEVISPIVEESYPQKVWIKASSSEYIPYSQNIGLIYEPFEINSSVRKPFGIYLKDFASILQTEDYLRSVDHIVLDLTTLLSEQNSNLKAILNAVKRISETKNGELSVVLDEPYPEIVEKLILYGADSFIVPQEQFHAFRQIVAKKEKKLLLKKLCRL